MAISLSEEQFNERAFYNVQLMDNDMEIVY